MIDPTVLIPTIIGILALAVISSAVLWAFRVPHRFAPVGAIARGAVQLALISVVLSGVITDARWVAVVLVVMFTVAWWTACRRIGSEAVVRGVTAAAMLTGVLVSAGVVFATGAVEEIGRAHV